MFVPAAPTPTIDSYLSKPRTDLASWLPSGCIRYFSSGRSAISRALTELQVPKGGVALLPSYLCDSAVAPFRLHGCRLVFFPIDRSLGIDLDEIERKIRSDDVNVILVIHYFGFPEARLSQLKQLCIDHKVALIEDCAHALFSRYDGEFLGSAGDASIFSLRKSLAIPEGGILRLRWQGQGRVSVATPRWKAMETIGLVRELAYWLEFRIGFSLRTTLLSADGFRRKVYAMDRVHPIDGEDYIGKISTFISARLQPDVIVAARRSHFCYWSEQSHLIPQTWVPLFQSLPEGSCPIGFPVLVDNRDEVRRGLFRDGIALRTYWDVLPGEIDEAEFPEAVYLRDRILVLPVHQSLKPKHLNAVLEALRKS